MPAMNLVMLVLGVLTSRHLTTGQWNAWQGNSGDSWLGGSISGWGNQDNEKADRAVCASEDNGIKFQITIKRRSNGWWGTSLELEFEVSAPKTKGRNYRLVLTEFGGDDNDGGCSQDNLGNLVKGRNHGSSWSWASGGTDGDLGEVDLTGDRRDSGTIRNLPVSNLKDLFGCGVALCEDVEDVEDDSGRWNPMHGSWNTGWHGMENNWRSGTEKRCTGRIPICCHLGKSDNDAMIKF